MKHLQTKSTRSNEAFLLRKAIEKHQEHIHKEYNVFTSGPRKGMYPESDFQNGFFSIFSSLFLKRGLSGPRPPLLARLFEGTALFQFSVGGEL